MVGAVDRPLPTAMGTGVGHASGLRYLGAAVGNNRTAKIEGMVQGDHAWRVIGAIAARVEARAQGIFQFSGCGGVHSRSLATTGHALGKTFGMVCRLGQLRYQHKGI